LPSCPGRFRFYDDYVLTPQSASQGFDVSTVGLRVTLPLRLFPPGRRFNSHGSNRLNQIPHRSGPVAAFRRNHRYDRSDARSATRQVSSLTTVPACRRFAASSFFLSFFAFGGGVLV
jgi:hypothetical protein